MAYGLRTFYPSMPSASESGSRRGCVVLANQSALVFGLSSLALLSDNEGKVGTHRDLIRPAKLSLDPELRK